MDEDEPPERARVQKAWRRWEDLESQKGGVLFVGNIGAPGMQALWEALRGGVVWSEDLWRGSSSDDESRVEEVQHRTLEEVEAGN